MEEAGAQNQIKEEMMQELKNLTPKEGRQMVKASSVLSLPNRDIVDALVFNVVAGRLSIEDQRKKEIKGAKFSEDQEAFWLFGQ